MKKPVTRVQLTLELCGTDGFNWVITPSSPVAGGRHTYSRNACGQLQV